TGKLPGRHGQHRAAARHEIAGPRRACLSGRRQRYSSPSAYGGSVAAIEITRLITGAVPLLALRRRAVRPLLRLHAPLGLLLDAVVADGSRGVQRLRDLRVGRRLEEAGIRRVAGPHPREAVGLQFDLDRGGARSGLREQTELVLDVMAVLVRDDVALRERAALRAETLLQFLKEADVEVDLLVIWTVEGTHRGLGETARALRVAGVDHRLRRQVGLAAAGERVALRLVNATAAADQAAH